MACPDNRPPCSAYDSLPESATLCRSKMVVGGGFEPPKALPADLQSAPFGRSGTPPFIYYNFTIKHFPGASEGTRTPDPLITNQ